MGRVLTNISKRDAILAAAVVELSGRGFHGARVERIAASAGANKQLIFHYFRSKGGLYAAAVSHILSTSPKPASSEAFTPPDALRRHVGELAAWLSVSAGSATALAECLARTDLPAEAVASARAWRDGVAAATRTLLEEGQRQGHFRDDLDHGAVVELVIGAAIGMALAFPARPGEALPAPQSPSALGQVIADYCGWR